jgi:hypothetical protein
MHRIKEKGLDMTFIGTICTGACLAQENVRIRDASRGCPPSFATIVFFSCGKPPVMTGLHVMTCSFYLNKRFDSRFELNLSISRPIVEFYIFLG